MASRAARFVRTNENEEEEEIGLIDLTRDDAARLACLRYGIRPDDEALLTSIAQSDVLCEPSSDRRGTER